MATDMKIWRKRAIDELKTIADEEWQRTIWFGGGGGRWVDSPSEQICSFDDLLIPEILEHPDHGLTEDQVSQFMRLSQMMDHLVDNTPDSISPEYLIDDPRWQDIRKQAAITLKTLAG